MSKPPSSLPSHGQMVEVAGEAAARGLPQIEPIANPL